MKNPISAWMTFNLDTGQRFGIISYLVEIPDSRQMVA